MRAVVSWNCRRAMRVTSASDRAAGATLQATRFGLPDDQRDAFVAVYGQDIRSWDGYPVLCDIRELSTLTALLRDGHADAAAQRELRIRLRSLWTGDDRVVILLTVLAAGTKGPGLPRKRPGASYSGELCRSPCRGRRSNA